AGVVPSIDPKDVVKKGRLRPGHIISVDFKLQRVFHDEEIKEQLASAQPYGQWIKENSFTLENIRQYAQRPARTFAWNPLRHGLSVESNNNKESSWEVKNGGAPRKGDPSDQGLRAFGYTLEALEMLLLPMAKQ
ncbi:unnamed protein product, partial [Polarella glacialis]